jgi:hypothetical protein
MSAADNIAAVLGGKRNGSGWMARCPCHMDNNASLSISEGSDGKALLKCHAGCRQDELMARVRGMGLDLGGRRPASADVATYDYRDRNGTVRYRVVRRKPKRFLQCQPDGKSGWDWNMAGVEPLPYRLPEMLAEPHKQVFVVEGEKDADRLTKDGLVATTNAGGAGKFRDELGRWFKDRDVVILPDNDAAGRKHASDVARRLHDMARKIRIVELPGLPQKGDVSDWLNAGKTVSDLRRLAHETPLWESEAAKEAPPRPEPVQTGEKSEFIVLGADLPATVYELRDLFVASGTLFDRGRVLCRLRADAQGVMLCQTLTVSNIVMAAHELCRPMKVGKAGDLVPITLPAAVARMYLEMGQWGLRPLAGTTTAPIMRRDGSIVGRSGYDEATQIYSDAPPNVDVPERPTEEQAAASLMTLREVFKTFPFADSELRREGDLFVVDLGQPPGLSESAYLASVLTAVARPSLWTAPGVMITAPHISGAGAGKGLLARAAAMIAYGMRPSAFTFGHDKNEFDKRLVAALLSGAPTLFIDNVNGALLRSETLASALTERPAQVRVMGLSAMLPLNAVTFVVLTGNGLRVSEDLARRILWVEVDPKVEDPEERPFKPGFLDMIAERRTDLLSAALTILRFGRVNAGRLPRGMPAGSFEQWCEWVRDPFLALGCRDPIEATRQAKRADPERRELAELFGTWSRVHGEEPVAAKDLDEAILSIINPQKKAKQFVTRMLQRMVGARYAGFVLTESRGGKHSAPTFALQGHGVRETLETLECSETLRGKENSKDENGTSPESAIGDGTPEEVSGVSRVSATAQHEGRSRDNHVNRLVVRKPRFARTS